MTALIARGRGWDVLLELDDEHPDGVVPVGADGQHGEVTLRFEALLAT